MAELVPIYPLYSLLFVQQGMSDAQVSGLFAIWSLVSVVAEVPSGALADRFSRRGCVVVSGVLQGAGYAVWITLPGFGGYAAGFVLWGLGGALVSGALEALLYDELTAVGAPQLYGALLGQLTAVALVAQLPAAAAATLLFGAGGYVLVAWVSVGTCVASSLLALRFPEAARVASAGPDASDDEPGTYLATVRAGLAEAAARRDVRAAVLAVALLTGLDAFEEYFTLLAHDWGVRTELVPLALAGIPVLGALGAALGGRAARLDRRTLAGLLMLSAVPLACAAVLRQPVGILGVMAFYAMYQLVRVAVDVRLQERIDGDARATVTSVAGLGSEVTALAIFAGWTFGGVPLVVALLVSIALLLPRWLR